MAQLLGRTLVSVGECVVNVDLQVGQNPNYGFEFISSLRNCCVSVDLDILIYSRWAGDDKREELAKKFAISGEKIFQRDIDSDEVIVGAVKTSRT